MKKILLLSLVVICLIGVSGCEPLEGMLLNCPMEDIYKTCDDGTKNARMYNRENSDTVGVGVVNNGHIAVANHQTRLRYSTLNHIDRYEGTIEFWARIDTDVSATVLQIKANNDNYVGCEFSSSDNKVGCGAWGNGVGKWQYIYSDTWNIGEWHHIAITYSTASNEMNIYYDGVLAGTKQFTGFESVILSTKIWLNKGCSNCAVSIDEFKIWDCAMATELNEYLHYFDNNPNVKKATLKNLNEAESDYFWMYLNELEKTGRIVIKEPTQFQLCDREFGGLCPTIYLTTNEAEKIYAGKLAHSIWLDKNRLVPWKLKDYNDNELDALFNHWFSENNDMYILFDGSPDEYTFYSVVDYSPSDIYDFTQQFVQDNDINSFYAIIDNVRTDFVHGISGRHPVNTAYSLLEAVTEYDEYGHRVSRKGCHSMVRIVNGLARNINIPAGYQTGWYTGTGHSTGFYPSTDKVLVHGDDIYNTILKEIPTDMLFMSLEYFNENVRPCGRWTSCAGDAITYWEENYRVNNP